MGEHSILAPSSAHIWGACSGSVLMQQMYPETEESEAAREGTAAHELAAEMVHGLPRAWPPSKRADLVGTLSANGVLITDEMYDSALTYAEDVVGVMRQTGNFNPHIEEKLPAVNRVHEACFGTPDLWLFDKTASVLYVWDFKYGYRKVEAFENPQLTTYTAGILEQLGLPDIEVRVEIRIVQPRAFHRSGPVRVWQTPATALRPLVNILEAKAAEAMGPGATCQSGPHCQDCSALLNCDPALTAGMGLYEAASKPTPINMSAHAVGLQLALVRRARKRLEKLEEAYEAQVTSRVKGGESVPFWTTEPTYGRTKWTRPAAEVLALGQLYGKDLSNPDAVKTPKQAEALGIDAETIKAYSETPRTGYKVVPDDANEAKRAFSHE